jgi:hypothetical protein
VSCASFSFDDSDTVRMQFLWQWAQEYAKNTPLIKADHSFTLGCVKDVPGVENGESVYDKDTIVMISGIYPNPNPLSGSQHYGCLRIWDGTGDHSDQ